MATETLNHSCASELFDIYTAITALKAVVEGKAQARLSSAQRSVVEAARSTLVEAFCHPTPDPEPEPF